MSNPFEIFAEDEEENIQIKNINNNKTNNIINSNAEPKVFLVCYNLTLTITIK